MDELDVIGVVFFWFVIFDGFDWVMFVNFMVFNGMVFGFVFGVNVKGVFEVYEWIIWFE